MINEMAPRPHNSGHFTLDACLTDQFQQQVTNALRIPTGKSRSRQLSSYGQYIWAMPGNRVTPAWNDLLVNPGVFLHLYGKKEPRKGRKMGHFTCTGEKVEDLLEQAIKLKRTLPGHNHELP